MGACTYWENDLQELFENLETDFSINNVRSFGESLWMIPDSTVDFEGRFEKIVYGYGDKKEIYTFPERDLISNIEHVIMFSEYSKKIREKMVSCRVIAVDLRYSADPVLDFLAFIKIYVKAIGNFAIFLAVADSYLLMGCNMLNRKDNNNCCISTPMDNRLNWTEVAELSYYIPDNTDFLPYYFEVLNVITSIQRCHRHDTFEESVEDSLLNARLNTRSFQKPNFKRLYSQQDTKNISNEYEDYYYWIEQYHSELSYIKTNNVNTLELLFEAELNEEKATEHGSIIDSISNNEDKGTAFEADVAEVKSLMNDPEELIHALKKIHKIN